MEACAPPCVGGEGGEFGSTLNSSGNFKGGILTPLVGCSVVHRLTYGISGNLMTEHLPGGASSCFPSSLVLNTSIMRFMSTSSSFRSEIKSLSFKTNCLSCWISSSLDSSFSRSFSTCSSFERTPLSLIGSEPHV